MDFDPLSFFTPESNEKKVTQVVKCVVASSTELESPLNLAKPDLEVKAQEEDGIIHVLDLPSLNELTPRYVILTILQLLAPDQETNFGSEYTTPNDDECIVNIKNGDAESLILTQQWLKDNGYIKLFNELLKIQFSRGFFNYLNKILSSPVFQDDDEIIQLTSLRISENCGRTARPNFIRQIILKNFDKPIFLNEPALTSDSLGLKTWGSSLVLSEYLVENNELLKSPVLELGSGTGLVGITISLLGYDVTLTDLPEILPNLVKNKELNEVRSDCLVLDWTDPSSFQKEKGNPTYKTIVVADPIYSPEHPLFVVNMICEFLDKSFEARVLLAIPIREKFEKEREYLWTLLKYHGLCVENEAIVDGFDDFGAQKFIYKEIRWNQI